MAMMEQIYIQGAPRSAHEINRRARRSEMDHARLGMTGWETGGGAWSHVSIWEKDAHAIAVSLAIASQASRVASNGAASVQTNGREAYSDGIGHAVPTGHAAPGSGRTPEESAQTRPAPGAYSEQPDAADLVDQRGRQRTPKPWLMAVLCRTGIHKGQWAFVVERNCVQGRECLRCGSVHARTKHEREWEYTSEGSCSQVNRCGRCDFTDDPRQVRIGPDAIEENLGRDPFRLLEFLAGNRGSWYPTDRLVVVLWPDPDTMPIAAKQALSKCKKRINDLLEPYLKMQDAIVSEKYRGYRMKPHLDAPLDAPQKRT